MSFTVKWWSKNVFSLVEICSSIQKALGSIPALLTHTKHMTHTCNSTFQDADAEDEKFKVILIFTYKKVLDQFGPPGNKTKMTITKGMPT